MSAVWLIAGLLVCFYLRHAAAQVLAEQLLSGIFQRRHGLNPFSAHRFVAAVAPQHLQVDFLRLLEKPYRRPLWCVWSPSWDDVVEHLTDQRKSVDLIVILRRGEAQQFAQE